MNRLAWLALVVSLAAACAVGLWSCSSDPGYLVVAITTDLQTPKDVDAVAVVVTAGGVTKYAYLGYPGAQGTMALPATLVVEQPRDPGTEVRVRVVGFRRGDARIVRDVVTTVPSSRGALLRVPLAYLDDGSAKGALPSRLAQGAASGPIAAADFDPLAVASTCDFGQHLTSIAGRCASAVVDSSALPDYDPGAVLGAGSCFDAVSCFVGAAEVTGLDPAACTAPLAAGADPPSNFALATADGAGACAGASRCLVPLLRDASEGWAVDGNVARFAPGVCSKLAAGAHLYASSACATKGPWVSTCTGAVGDAGTDGAVDATVHDEGEAGSEAGALDGGLDCAPLLARMLASTIVPPTQYAGLDFSNDGGASGSFGSGGVSVADLLACATTVEPDATEAGVLPYPGYREATFGTPLVEGGIAPVSVAFNLQSRVVYELGVGPGYTGQTSFHSRAGGAYGTHTYVVSVENPVTGASGVVLRDGAPFDVAWTDDAGAFTANAWVNELYDGLMATFMPQVPAVANCRTTKSSLYFPGSVLPEQETNCLVIADGSVGDTVVGVRPLRFYLLFEPGTNRVKSVYTFWLGGVTSCGTPVANQERMIWDGMGFRFGPLADGGARYGYSLGGVYSFPGIVNGAGLTEVEANAVECNGVAETPPDPGYDMVSWGANRELAMEYNRATGINYKLFARTGYRAPLIEFAGEVDTYDVSIGSLLRNQTPVHIDWTSQATALPEITAIANAWFYSWCLTPADTDCVAQGDCTITLDDGAGHSSFLLSQSAATFDACGVELEPLGFVFPRGTSDLSQFFLVNPDGK